MEMKILSREAMQRLPIQAKEENYYELFLLEFATGLRLGELMGLQWDDLDLTTGELRVKVESRWLFPSPKKEDLPLRPSVVHHRLHRLLYHAGCERIRFHDLRHTNATNFDTVFFVFTKSVRFLPAENCRFFAHFFPQAR